METQNQLEESQKRLTAAQEIAKVGDWELDLETDMIWASEEAFKIYGIERGDGYFPSKVLAKSVYPEYRELLNRKLANLIAKEDEYDVEFIIRKGFTREDCHIHSIAILQKDGAGNPTKVTGTIQDITRRKRQENKLIETERKFRRAINESPVPIMLRAEDGEILELSRTWSTLTGYQLKDIPTIEKWMEAAYEPNDLNAREAVEALSSLEESKHLGEYPVKTKTGTVLIWDFYLSMIGRLEDGRKVIMSVGIDVTEEKERQKEMVYLSFHVLLKLILLPSFAC